MAAMIKIVALGDAQAQVVMATKTNSCLAIKICVCDEKSINNRRSASISYHTGYFDSYFALVTQHSQPITAEQD